MAKPPLTPKPLPIKVPGVERYDDLSVRDMQILIDILGGVNKKIIAEKAGIHILTLEANLRRNTALLKHIREHQHAALGYTQAMFCHAIEKAQATIFELMDEPAPPMVRLSASKEVMRMAGYEHYLTSQSNEDASSEFADDIKFEEAKG